VKKLEGMSDFTEIETKLLKYLGEPGTAIPKVKRSPLRKQLVPLLREYELKTYSGSIPPTLRLLAVRASVLGFFRIAPPPTKEELAAALNFNDLKRTARSGGILVYETSNIIAALLLSILKEVKNRQRLIRETISTFRGLIRTVQKRNAILSSETIEMIVESCGKIISLKEFWDHLKGGARLKFLKSIIHDTFRLLELVAHDSIPPGVAVALLKFLGTVTRSVPSIILSDLRERPEMDRLWTHGVDVGLKGLGESLINGNVQVADKLFNIGLEIDEKSRMEKILREVRHQKEGELRTYVLDWIDSKLSVEHREVSRIGIPQEYLMGSTLTRNLGSALLACWEASDKTPDSARCYEILKVVFEESFGLRLRGKPGSIVMYDPTLHELILGTSAHGQPVNLLKPLVEWVGEQGIRIVIKGAVKPIEERHDK
jgi:hypothetical protein